MQFKRSAGIFMSGFFMSVGGYILAIVSFAGAASSFSAFSSRPNVVAVVLAILGLLISLAGGILVLVAIYRALVKIDALPISAGPVMQNSGGGRTSGF